MTAQYDKEIGRLHVAYHRDYGDHTCVLISCVDGWNDSCQAVTHRLSLEEARDLRYLLDRMIAAAKRDKKI